MKKKLLLFFSLALILGINSAKSQVQEQLVVFPTQTVHAIDGIAWASSMGTNFITGSSFWVYINPNLEAIVAKKSADGTITTKVLMQNVPNNNNHAEFSLGVDNEGYIHVIGGIHNASPKYYVSTNPDDITSFEFRGNDLANGGLQGNEVTYQSFTRSNKGTLFVTYRSNVVGGFVTGARAIALGRYDTKTKKWTMLGGKNYQVTTTTSCTPTTGDQTGLTAFVWNNSGVGDMRPAAGKCFSHAHYQGYQLKIKFDQNNRMHVTYNMADSINTADGDVSKFMTHLFYAYSDDEGNTWFKANGSRITTLPITKATGDLVHKRIPPGYVYPNTTSTGTMPNASSLILDKDGVPIVVQFDYIANSTLMFKWSGTSWVNQTSFTNRGDRFYTDLSRQIIYNFGPSRQFQMSYDNMASFTNAVTMVNPATWYVIVDDFYLTKTRNVMYYARDETAGNATIMNMVVSSPDALAPAAPAGLFSSEIVQNSITLNWTPSPELDVSRYDVYNDGTLVGSTGSSYYSISGLSPLTSYTFTVKAVDGSGNESSISSGLVVSTTDRDTQAPVIPSGLSATEVTGSSFKLNWNAATDNVGVVSYQIYKDNVWLASTVNTSYQVTALSGSTTYGMSVRAKDGAGNLSSPIVRNVKTYGSGLIIFEPYNYTVGTTANDPDGGIGNGAGLPATNAGGNPTGTGTGLRGIYGTEASVVEGLTYLNLATSGGAHKITNATWGSNVFLYRFMTTDPFLSKRVAANGNFGVDGQSLYFSFIATTSSSTPAAFCIALGGSRNVFIENTATGWTINDNKANAAPTSATLELNTPTLLVVKVDFKAGIADVVSLYKNPPIDGTLGSPAASLTVGADYTFGNLTTRPNVANAMTIDEFRMGLSYADVTPSAPITLNNAPTFALSQDSINVMESTGSVDSIANFASSIDDGNPEANQVVSFEVTTDNDALFEELPKIDSITGALTYKLKADAFGLATVTVLLKDNGANEMLNLNTSAPQTFTIDIKPINDAPTLAALTNLSLPFNAGEQTVSLAGIGSGSAFETQTLTITTVSSNPALISPAVTYSSPAATGTLTLTPATTLAGTAVITVTVSDDGGTANGGVDKLTRSFTVNVAKGTQAITFAQLADYLFESGPFALTATAGSELPVSYSLVSGPARLSDNMLSPTGIGPVTIRATQAGNDHYLAAAEVTQTFNIVTADRDRGVKPELECVTDNRNGTFTATFGYKNDMGMTVYIPAGASNYITPKGDVIQPEFFQTGDVQGVISLTFPSRGSVSWSIAGPDGKIRTATATRSAVRCTAGARVAAAGSGAEEAELTQAQVYPNPASGKVFVRVNAEREQRATVKLVSNLSKVALEEGFALKTGNNVLEIGVQNLPSGVYTLQVYKDEQVITHKVVIRR